MSQFWWFFFFFVWVDVGEREKERMHAHSVCVKKHACVSNALYMLECLHRDISCIFD